MADHTTQHARWLGMLSTMFLTLTILVGTWYLSVWFDPYGPWNPFPPQGTDSRFVLPVRVAYAAANDPSQPTPTFPPTWTPTATGTATPTRLPSSTPWPTSTPTPTPKPDPLWRYYIPGMRGRRYEGSKIQLHGVFGKSPDFTAYLIFYSSDGLRISGMMNVPNGRGPFPVIILCHGFVHPDKYATGNDTWRQADYLATNGYITIAPDYRSHAASDNGVSFYHVGYATDILNLIASLKSIDKADSRRIGLWGHSMGGAVALKAAVVSRQVDAVAVFGSVHADERVNFAYSMGNGPGAYGVAWFGTPKSNPIAYKRLSPINYLDRSPPLSIHHGTGDSMVPYQWSEDLYEAAKEQGAVVELYLYPDAEHTFVDQTWDLAMERTLAFFDRYVK